MENTTNRTMKGKGRIVYMGTPEFAVPPLKALLDAGIEVSAVVTAPDREAGRGQKTTPSAVKVFAIEHGLRLLQPEKLRDPEFLSELRSLQPALAVVVAFRMLPEVVWSLPQLGTINLHASLLPQYRGAAPINWAIINGEVETGVTTFFIRHEIDTGQIIHQQKVGIGPDTTAGQLHDQLCEIGSQLLTRSVIDVLNGNVKAIDQEKLLSGELRHAPKIFKPNCLINWNSPAHEVRNLIRGLAPYPGAYTELELPNGERLVLKVYSAYIGEDATCTKPGAVKLTAANQILMACSDRFLVLQEVQLAGKRKMSAQELVRGVRWEGELRAL